MPNSFNALFLIINFKVVSPRSNLTFSDCQKQVIANLANFSYDPLNFTWLLEAQVPEVFSAILSSSENCAQLKSLAFGGVCNLTLG